MINAGGVSAFLDLDTGRFNSGMAAAQKSMDGFSKKVGDVGKKMTAFVTTPILGIAAAAIKLGTDFEAGMSEVQAISKATGSEMETLEKLAREMGATTKFSATEASEGLKYMAMAGWDVEKMSAALPGVLSLAAASGENLGTVSDIVTDAMTAFGLEAGKAGDFADLLAVASSKSNTNVGLLGESFKYVAPVMGALGATSEDTATALGLMANAGIKGGQAGNQLKNIVTRLIAPVGDAKDVLLEYGIAAQTNADGTVNLGATMDNLRSTMGNMTETQQAQIASLVFGKESMAGALTIINATEESYQELINATHNASGAAQEMADIMMNNTKGSITELKSAMEELMLKGFEAMKPVIDSLVTVVRGFVDRLNELSPAAQENIVKFLALVAAIGPLLLVISKIANPVGLAITAFTLMAGAVMYLWTTNEDFRKAVEVIWGNIKDFISKSITTIQDVIKKTTDTIKTFWDKWGTDILAFATKTWNSIRDIISLMIEAVKAVIEKVAGQIEKFWDKWGKAILKIAETAWNSIKGAIDTILTIIKGIIQTFIGLITGDWDKFGEGLKTIWSGVWTGIKTIIEGAWSLLKLAFSTLYDAISGWFKGLVSDALGWGGDMIKGLWDGISGATGWLSDKVKGFAEGVANTFKDFFGIKSPSTLMAQYGKHMDEGLADGIENNEHMPLDAIKSLGEKMADAATAELTRVQTIQAHAQSIVNVAKSLSGAVQGPNNYFGDGRNDFSGYETDENGLPSLDYLFDDIGISKTGDYDRWMGTDPNSSRKASGLPPTLYNDEYLSLTDEQKYKYNLLHGNDKVIRENLDRYGKFIDDEKYDIFKNRYARGTNYAVGGYSWVGEQGPELLKLPRGSQVIPNQASERMASKGITQNITINSPTALKPSEIARQTKNASRGLAMEWGI